MACAEAAAELDYPALFAAFAGELDPDDVRVEIDGSSAEASLPSGLTFSLDENKSGEWKVDGLRLPGGDAERPAPRAPRDRNGSTRPDALSGGNVPSGGGAQLPSPQVRQTPQLPQR